MNTVTHSCLTTKKEDLGCVQCFQCAEIICVKGIVLLWRTFALRLDSRHPLHFFTGRSATSSLQQETPIPAKFPHCGHRSGGAGVASRPRQWPGRSPAKSPGGRVVEYKLTAYPFSSEITNAAKTGSDFTTGTHTSFQVWWRDVA